MLWIQSELNKPKHVAEILIVIIDYQNMLFIDWSNYCITAKHNVMAAIKVKNSF